MENQVKTSTENKEQQLKKLSKMTMIRSLLPIAGLIIIFLMFNALTNFRMMNNLPLVLSQVYVTMISATGVFFIMTMGGLDFSQGSILGIASIVVCMVSKTSIPLAIVAGIAVGAAIGAINGYFYVYRKIKSFIVTICTMFLFRGFIKYLTTNAPVAGSAMLINFDSTELKLACTLVVLIIGFILFRFTKFGTYLKAIGAGEKAAMFSGIRTDRMKFLIYTLAGAITGFAAFINVIKVGSVTSSGGNQLETQILIALVLGGMPISGGAKVRFENIIGVGFDKNPDGSLKYTKEGAHSQPRICFHEDITGKEITTTLQTRVKELPNVEIREYTVMTDILVEKGICTGILAKNADGDILKIHAKDTVLATGGIGGLYKHSTNFPSLTGDGLDVAKKHGVRLEHLDYVQIHPTSLYSKKPGRSFLISESTRGEGAVLLNGKGERFVDELLPRDVVTQAIEKEMEKEGSDHVWLSFEAVPEETIRGHFPHIYEECLKEGYDITKEPAPVVPAQHYFMGGIYVDHFSETTMNHLYAVGETSCNGVHGKNRLASNSLLESLVFAERAAGKIAGREDEEYESNYDAACCG